MDLLADSTIANDKAKMLVALYTWWVVKDMDWGTSMMFDLLDRAHEEKAEGAKEAVKLAYPMLYEVFEEYFNAEDKHQFFRDYL